MNCLFHLFLWPKHFSYGVLHLRRGEESLSAVIRGIYRSCPGLAGCGQSVEKVVPEVLIAPSQVGGAVQIELNGRVDVLGEVADLDHDDPVNPVLEGLHMSSTELHQAPLALQEVPGNKKSTK
ncbi:hypothetical protein TNCV_4354921 [Trichonephila clavipes]|nr:hypothetical protein TNCV_4354921 [Trichonephila clavipes]